MAHQEDPYKKYLEEKHKGFTTPESLVNSMVLKAVGSEASSLRKIVQGEVNEVYEAKTPSQNIIVRISRLGPQNFETEETVIRLALQAGVPAPKVLLIESASTETEDLTFCIEEKIEGSPLKDILKTIPQEDLKKIVYDSGAILSKIHAIETDRFGPLDRSAFYSKWTDFLFRFEENKPRIFDFASTVGLLPEVLEKAFDIQRKNRGVMEIDTPFTLHGDFSPKHILTDGKVITGIIDFEDAKGGDPVRDIAWLDFFYSGAFPLEWFLEGYQNKAVLSGDFNKKMSLLRLNLSIDLIDYYGSERNISGLKYSKRKLEEELANF